MSLLKTLIKLNRKQLLNITVRRLCAEATSSPEVDTKLSGYAKSFEKFTNINDEKPKEPQQTFATLLRNSKFIDLGVAQGKIVQGKIFHTVEDDLYIDFGWKFHCVCPRPRKDPTSYVRGARVRLLIKDLELSSKFLGFEKDLTILEADCILLGLAQERKSS